MTATTRPISWIKAARKDFDDFPVPVQTDALRARIKLYRAHTPYRDTQ